MLGFPDENDGIFILDKATSGGTISGVIFQYKIKKIGCLHIWQ